MFKHPFWGSPKKTMETPWAWQELWVILLKSYVSWSCLIYCILSILDLCSIYQIDILYTIFIYYRLLFDVSKIFFWYRSRSRNTPVMILRDDSPGKLDVVGWMHLVLPQRVYPNIPQHCNVGKSTPEHRHQAVWFWMPQSSINT